MPPRYLAKLLKIYLDYSKTNFQRAKQNKIKKNCRACWNNFMFLFLIKLFMDFAKHKYSQTRRMRYVVVNAD